MSGALSHSMAKTGVEEQRATLFSKHFVRIEESFGKHASKTCPYIRVNVDKSVFDFLLHCPVVSALNNGGPCS